MDSRKIGLGYYEIWQLACLYCSWAGKYTTSDAESVINFLNVCGIIDEDKAREKIRKGRGRDAIVLNRDENGEIED